MGELTRQESRRQPSNFSANITYLLSISIASELIGTTAYTFQYSGLQDPLQTALASSQDFIVIQQNKYSAYCHNAIEHKASVKENNNDQPGLDFITENDDANLTVDNNLNCDNQSETTEADSNNPITPQLISMGETILLDPFANNATPIKVNWAKLAEKTAFTVEQGKAGPMLPTHSGNNDVTTKHTDTEIQSTDSAITKIPTTKAAVTDSKEAATTATPAAEMTTRSSDVSTAKNKQTPETTNTEAATTENTEAATEAVTEESTEAENTEAVVEAVAEETTEEITQPVTENTEAVETPNTEAAATNNTEAAETPNTEAAATDNTEAAETPNTEAAATDNTEAAETPNTEAAATDNTEAAETPNTEAAATENTEAAETPNTEAAATDNTEAAETPNSEAAATDNTEAAETPNPEAAATDNTEAAETPNTEAAATENTEAAETPNTEAAATDNTEAAETPNTEAAATDNTEAAETPNTEAAATDNTEAAETPNTEAAATDNTEAAETPNTEAAATDNTEAAETPNTEAAATDNTEAAETPNTEAAATDNTEAAETPNTEAAATDNTEAAETPNTEAAATDNTEAAETPNTEAAATDNTEAAETPNTEAAATDNTEAAETPNTEAAATDNTEAAETPNTEAAATENTEAAETPNTEAAATDNTEAAETPNTEAAATDNTEAAEIPNSAPSWQPIAAVQLNQAQTHSLTLLATDAENEAITYSIDGTTTDVAASISADQLTLTLQPDFYGNQDITITATDSAGNTTNTTVSIAVNAAPIINPAAAQAEAIQYVAMTDIQMTIPSNLFEDPDADASQLTYTVANLPTGIHFDANTNTISGKTLNNVATETAHQIEITATDQHGASVTQTLEINVTPNSAPSWQPIAAVQLNQAQTHSLTLLATDAENEAITYSIDGTTTDVAASISADQLTLTLQPDFYGNQDITITATDSAGNTTNTTVSIAVNAAPIINPAAAQAEAIQYVAMTDIQMTIPSNLFEDPDADASQLTYTVANLPTGIHFDANTNTISGKTLNNVATETAHQIEITATDQHGASVTQTLEINVTPNSAPSWQPIAAVQLNQAQTHSLTLLATDAENEAITYSIDGTTTDVAASISADQLTLTLQPDFYGNQDITITATDSAGNTTNTTVSIAVNAAPIINPAAAQAEAIQYVAMTDIQMTIPSNLFEDPDADASQLTYTVANLPTGIHFDANTNTISGKTLNNVATETAHQIEITATDQHGASVTQAFEINVTPNSAPSWQPIAAVQLNQAQTHSLTLLATDAENEAITYSIDGTTTDVAASISADQLTLTLQPDFYGNQDITITATDSAGNTTDTTVSIAVNAAPIINPAETQAEAIQYVAMTDIQMTIPSNLFEDPDADASQLTYTVANLPTGIHFDANTNTISGKTLSNVETETAHQIEITATDQHGASVTQTLEINVTPNSAPSWQPIAAVQLNQAQTHSLTLLATDAENEAITYSIDGTTTDVAASISADQLTLTLQPDFYGNQDITITATDSAGNTTDTTVSIAVNAAPIINPAETQAEAIQYVAMTDIQMTIPSNLFEDPDADASQLTYTVANLPTGIRFDANTNIISGKTLSNVETETAHQIEITATDQHGASVTQTLEINVTPNSAPSWQPIAAVQLNQAQTHSLTLLATDAENEAITYSIDGTTTDVAASISADQLTLTLQPDFYGNQDITITATDSAGNTTDTTVSIAVNAAPIINPAAAQAEAIQYVAMTEIQMTIPSNLFEDPDADASQLTYTVANLPTGIHFDANTNTISGKTLSNVETETAHQIEITATDQHGASVTQTLEINVTPNSAPSWQPIAAVQLNQAQTHSLTLLATDAENEAITYSIDGTTTDVAASIHADQLTLTLQPDFYGNQDITITATDSAGNTTDTTVSIAVNAAPIINPAAAQAEAIQYVAMTDIQMTIPSNLFEDPDADSSQLTYTVANLPTGIRFDANTNTFSGKTLNNVATETAHQIEITATDQHGASVTQAFEINVTPNTAPTIFIPLHYSQSEQSINISDSDTYQFTVPTNLFKDANNGDTLTLSAIIDQELDQVFTFDQATNTFSANTAGLEDFVDEEFDIGITATDMAGNSVTDWFTIEIEE